MIRGKVHENNLKKNTRLKYKCPCCGYYTFDEKPNENYDICEVCFGEDDPIQLNNPYYEGGANHVSLIKAQMNFFEFGI